jgi:hypothetical protein
LLPSSSFECSQHFDIRNNRISAPNQLDTMKGNYFDQHGFEYYLFKLNGFFSMRLAAIFQQLFSVFGAYIITHPSMRLSLKRLLCNYHMWTDYRHYGFL